MTSRELQEFKSTFSKQLKNILDSNSVSQRELAKMVGVSESTVGKWLLCKATPRMGIIEKLSSIFGVPKSYFFNDKEDRHTYYMNPETAKLADFLEKNKKVVDFIQKYISLDERGKAVIDAALEHEYEFEKSTNQEKHA